jgi:hypothetical protein
MLNYVHGIYGNPRHSSPCLIASRPFCQERCCNENLVRILS